MNAPAHTGASAISAAALREIVIESYLRTLRDHKERCDKAIEQLSARQLHEAIAPGTNSPAVIMRHLSGNLASRFTDFLASDGEKPGRDRDSEFVDDHLPREAQIARWNAAWSLFERTIAALSIDDLARTITIRSEPHSVPRAIERALTHVAYHTGQLLLIARLIKERQPRATWSWVTVPPGGSRAHNETMGAIFRATGAG